MPRKIPRYKIRLDPDGTAKGLLPGEGPRIVSSTFPNTPLVNQKRQKLKNNFNPYGNRGFAAHGIYKMPKSKTTSPTKLARVLDSREIKELCAKQAPLAIKVFRKILLDEQSTDMAKIAAGLALFDRGYGKPTQTTVNAQVNADGAPSEIDDKELAERIDAALRRIENIAGGKAEPAPSPQRPADLRKLN